MSVSSALDRIGDCPVCKGILTPETIRPGPFNCPYCAMYIRLIRRRRYTSGCVSLCAESSLWRRQGCAVSIGLF